MPRILRGRHAELVGDVVVEPGQPIPADADPDVVKRLEADGLLSTQGERKRSTPTKDKEGD